MIRIFAKQNLSFRVLLKDEDMKSRLVMIILKFLSVGVQFNVKVISKINPITYICEKRPKQNKRIVKSK